MKGPGAFALLALAVAAGLGSFALLLLQRAPSEASGTVAASPLAPEPQAELLARLEALAAENRELRERLDLLERRPTPEPRAPISDFVAREDFDAFRDEVLAALASRTAPAGEPQPLKDEVAEALTAIRKEERVDAVRGYQEKRAARLGEDLNKLEEWLELAPYQVEGMRVALTAQYEREDALRQLWEDGEDDEYLAERKQSDAALFQEDLDRVLDAEQVETFWREIGRRRKN